MAPVGRGQATVRTELEPEDEVGHRARQRADDVRRQIDDPDLARPPTYRDLVHVA